MHDIDRTLLEYEADAGSMEFEGDPEFSDEYGNEFEFEFESEGPFNEADEMELAAELLEVASEEELDQFIGKLFKKAVKFIKSPAFRPLGGILKGIAKQALPMVGGALGTMVMPGVGTALGSNLASTAGKMYGLELEGMSGEDQEFEVARRFVRFAGDAAQEADAAPTGEPPEQVAQAAATTAATKHAPGLVSARVARGRRYPAAGRPGGRWIRRGRHIILIGVY